MTLSEQLSNASTQVNEWLNGQEWYQQLKAKWDELDSQSKSYLQITFAIGAAALTLYLILSFIWGVHRLKQEVADKSEILMSMENANEDLKRLRAINSTLASVAPGNDPWPAYFETTAGPIGITKAGFSVSEGKAGTATDLSKEMMFEISLKKLNIHQLVRYAYALETGARPVKLRNLTLDTAPDMSGYLDATLAVSAFTQLNNSPPNGK